MRTIILLFLIILISANQILADESHVRNVSILGPRTEVISAEDYQTIVHVSIQTGSDKSGDGSRQAPWMTLAHALFRVADASETRRYAIFVASGTYGDRTLVMSEFVDLYGGFDPRTWERDILTHQTIVDGMGVRRVVIGADHSRIDGFAIVNGLSSSHGGGILCDDTSPLISNNIIKGNLVLEPVDFNDQRIHQQGNHGGGIACLYNAVPVIRNNIICENRTSVGCGAGVAFFGWLRMEGAPATTVKDNRVIGGLQAVLENNIILNNISGINDIQRTRSSSGGGVSCAEEARPIIRNNLIANNQARGRSDAGGIYAEYFSYPLIEGNWILGNVSDDDGGGIYIMKQSHPEIRENYIAGNWTTGGGAGGIRISKEGRAKIANNIVVHNQTGGGVQSVDSYMELVGNIIMHNQGGSGLSFSTLYSYFIPSIVRNIIIRENERASILLKNDATQSLIVEFNNIEGGYEGEGNSDEAPDFPREMMMSRIKEIRFDSVQLTTTIRTVKALEGKLTGRVVRLGERWGVIQDVSGRDVLIRGDLSPRQNASEFMILPFYRIE